MANVEKSNSVVVAPLKRQSKIEMKKKKRKRDINDECFQRRAIGEEEEERIFI